MIPDFDSLKKQLRELASVVNEFKSEAVQLRVIDLVLGAPTADQDDGVPNEVQPPSHAPKRKRRTKKSRGSEAKGKSSIRSGKPGGAAMLTRLLDDGYFAKPKTIKSIVEHCDSKFGFKYPQSAFSGPLVRAVRDDKLKRLKNKDGQYEYSNPS